MVVGIDGPGVGLVVVVVLDTSDDLKIEGSLVPRHRYLLFCINDTVERSLRSPVMAHSATAQL